MKLAKVRITEFQSIQDSTEFEIGDVTCLVGKNEAGKTALLKALYRLNPIVETAGDFNVTYDYPSRNMYNYKRDVETGHREPATVVQATYTLEPADITAVEKIFGSACLKDKKPTLTLKKGYSNELLFNDLNINTDAALKHLIKEAGLPAQDEEQMVETEEMVNALSSNPPRKDRIVLVETEEMVNTLTDTEQTEDVQKLTPMLQNISTDDISHIIYNKILYERIPKFLYFDEYYQMKGQDNIEALKHRVESEQFEDSDHPLLGLIELAELDLDQLINPQETQLLKAGLQAASNALTQKVLPYWSQNQHLRMEFDVRQAYPGDPTGMQSGTNIWGYVENTRYNISTLLGTRSRGFVWFFSFLAWYQNLRRDNENIILLLDEPGLSLHAKAQGDLLRYFEEELKPHHQLIYTTHSPFMVDPAHFDRVRIVQDLSIELDSDDLPEEQQGTRVIKEVLEATPDSLFPLQGALGYEIHQPLFIGPNCLIVEGVSDLLYIQTISALLQEKGQNGLKDDWTITPVGGAGNVPTFVALIGAQEHLNVAVLIDFQKKDRQSTENLYKVKLLEKKKVLTYDQFIKGDEADIEDMFDADFYLQLVNEEFGTNLTVDKLPKGATRIVSRLEQHIKKNPLPKGAKFNHYRPARYLSENIGSLKSKLTDPQLDRFQKVFDTLNKLLRK